MIKHAKNLFIPHTGNNHKPHALRHRALVGYSVFLIAVKALAVIAPIALPGMSVYGDAITPTNIVNLTNQTRAGLNLKILTVESRLTVAAERKAQDMAARGYFAHASPDGVRHTTLITEAGYTYAYSGENLAVHYASAENVQAGWLASPSHRANIVNPRYTEIGVGVASGVFEGIPTTFVAELFGKPMSALAVGETAPVEPTVSTPAPVSVENVTVIPKHNTLQVTIKSPSLVAATVQLGDQSTTLTQEEANVWRGVVNTNSTTIAPNGESLNVTAVEANGATTTTPVALAAPTASTQDLYAYTEPHREARFFGLLTVKNLNDTSRLVYVYFLIFLSVALLMNIFIKIRVQHPSIITHAVAVAGLAVFLLLV